MEHPDAPAWAQSFENKTISELQEMEVPKGLAHIIENAWRTAHRGALKAARRREADAAAEASAAEQAIRQTLVQQIAARADQLRAEEASCIPKECATAPPEDDVQDAELLDEDDAGDADDTAGIAEEQHAFISPRAENLRERLSAAIARNDEPLPEPIIKPASVPQIIPRMLPMEAMEIQLSSSASLVELLARQFCEQEFPTHMTCEIMRSMAILIAANATLGKSMHLFNGNGSDVRSEGRRSNA